MSEKIERFGGRDGLKEGRGGKRSTLWQPLVFGNGPTLTCVLTPLFLNPKISESPQNRTERPTHLF